MKIEEKIALCGIKHHDNSHIELDLDLCRMCQDRICLAACPGQLYSLSDDETEVIVEYTGCLECGTCLVICPHGAVRWHYPEPGFGIRYRHG